MDPTQYVAVRNAARAVAAEAVVHWETSILAHLLTVMPDAARSDFLSQIQGKVDKAKKHYLSVALANCQPEVSDLIAREFQEAFDRICARAMKQLKSDGAPAT